MKYSHFFLAAFLIVLPTISFAQGDAGAAAAAGFVARLNEIILFPLIALLMGVAFLVFLWGCAQYIMGAANPSAREEGIKHITYGIIGLVIMVSAWAILQIAAATFGLDDELNSANDGSYSANPGGTGTNGPGTSNPGGTGTNGPGTSNPGGTGTNGSGTAPPPTNFPAGGIPQPGP